MFGFGNKYNIVKNRTIDFLMSFNRKFFSMFCNHLLEAHKQLNNAYQIVHHLDIQIHTRASYWPESVLGAA